MIGKDTDNLFLSQDAFLRHIQRKAKDNRWAHDVRMHDYWTKRLEKYPLSKVTKEKIDKIEARWPGKF
jgi:hypothetical protein